MCLKLYFMCSVSKGAAIAQSNVFVYTPNSHICHQRILTKAPSLPVEPLGEVHQTPL